MVSERDLIKGSLGPMILFMISEKPMYGYQMIKELEQKSRGYFCFKEGTLYPALHRLENTGLIQGKWQTTPSGRQRRYYYITEKGRVELVRERNRWRSFISAVRLVIPPTASEV